MRWDDGLGHEASSGERRGELRRGEQRNGRRTKEVPGTRRIQGQEECKG